MVRAWSLATLAAFGANTYVTYVIGSGTGGGAWLKKLLSPDGKTNKEISALHPTLVTPAGWAFAIWGPIFIGEAANALWQCFAPDDEVGRGTSCLKN